MKKRRKTVMIKGKPYDLARGDVARVYSAESTSPCGEDKPLRLWLREGRKKANSSYHSLDELEKLNAFADEKNGAAKAFDWHFVTPTRDEAMAIIRYREDCDDRKEQGKEIRKLSDLVTLTLDRENKDKDTDDRVPTISGATEMFIAKKKKKITKQRIEAYQHISKVLIDNLGDKKLCEVSRKEVEALFAGKLSTLAVGSRELYAKQIKSLFNWSYEEIINDGFAGNDVLPNPLKRLEVNFREKPAEGKEEEKEDPKIITPDELKDVLKCARDKRPDQYLPVVVLTAFCGMRREEGFKLKWKDIRYEHKNAHRSELGWIFLPGYKAKNNIPRSAKIPDNARAWLSLTKNRNPEDFIVSPNVTGKKRMDTLKNALGYFYRKLGLKKEVLRHSCVTYLAIRLKNDAKAAKICGHSTRVADRHYRNLSTPDVANAWFNILP